jgi:hypothetical protein
MIILPCLSGHGDDDLTVVDIDPIRPQRRGAGGRTSGVKLKSVQMQRAEDDLVVDLPVSDRSALVRASRGHGAQAAVALAGHRDLMIAKGKSSTFSVGDLVDRAA